jgi:hypothetical protein
MTKLTLCSCGRNCDYAGCGGGGACWGEVDVVDEIPDGDDGYMWVHTCEGHKDLYLDRLPFKPDPNP